MSDNSSSTTSDLLPGDLRRDFIIDLYIIFPSDNLVFKLSPNTNIEAHQSNSHLDIGHAQKFVELEYN